MSVDVNVKDPCRKGLSFMRLPEPGTPYQLLSKYSPSQLVIYNEAYFYAVENGRESGGAEQPNHIDDYYELDVDYIAKMAWVTPDEVVETIKTTFKDDFDLLEVNKPDGKNILSNLMRVNKDGCYRFISVRQLPDC